MPESKQKIVSVEALRGIAALAVAWFHFTNGDEDYLSPGILKASGKYGWLGVEMFFVISGFIIPYAFYRSAYEVRSYGTFLLKRLVRLHPPYLVAITFIIVLNYLSALASGFQGEPQLLSWGRILTHLTYSNGLLGYQTFNPAFWTLSIEFQWYLLIGLVFPLLCSDKIGIRLGCAIGFAALAVALPTERLAFHFAFLFLTGVFAFQFACGLIDRTAYAISLVVATAGVGFTVGWPAAVVSFLTAILISFSTLSWKWVGGLGAVSYSLYLLHVPVGGRIVNLSKRLPDAWAIKWLAVSLALGISLLAAWLLWRFVEKPAQEMSSRLRYSKTKRDGPAAEQACSHFASR